MRILADAVARIERTVSRPRQDRIKAAANRISATLARADAEFKEEDHPRAPDGKFSSGGGLSAAASHGIAAYKSTLKPGAKATSQGFIKFMIKSNQYSAKDIFQAAQSQFNLPDEKKGIVKTVYNKLVNIDKLNLPPLPKNSTVGTPAPSTTAAPPKAKPQSMLPSSGGVPDHLSDKEIDQIAYNLPDDISVILGPVVENYSNLTAENKPKVFKKLDEIQMAYSQTGADKEKAVLSLDDISGAGMSVSTVNSAIKKMKADMQASMGAAPPTYTPNTNAQKTSFAKLSKAPPKKKNNIEHYENSQGVEVECVLKTDTKNIPGDFYAKVSSSYGGVVDHSTADSIAVNHAMEDYHNSIYSSMPVNQADALSSYQGSGYEAINDVLRGLMPETPQIKKKINAISSAIESNYIPADTPVYRGLKATLKDLTGFDDPKEAVGRVFQHKNFASCSRSSKVSEKFAQGYAGKSSLLKFVIPAGTNGVVMSGQETYEKEILLNRNSTFRIDHVDLSSGNPVISVTYMGISK